MTNEERQAYNRARYIKHREEIKNQVAAWQAANPEKCRKYDAAYRNKPSVVDKTKAYNRRYYIANKDAIMARRSKVSHNCGTTST